MWPHSRRQSLLAFWSVGVAPLTKQPEDSACEIDVAWVQVPHRRLVSLGSLAGMLAVKLCGCSSCRRRMFSFVREVAQVVPAVTSKIHRWHMRTRRYIYRRH